MRRPIEERVTRVAVGGLTAAEMEHFSHMDDEHLKEYIKSKFANTCRMLNNLQEIVCIIKYSFVPLQKKQ